MNSGIENLNINKQPNVNQNESPNMNHEISQKKNEVDLIFIKQIEQKSGNRSLSEFNPSVSNEEGKPLIKKENTEKNSTNNEKNLNETLEKLENSKENLAELEKSKKNNEEDLEKIKDFQKGIKEAEAKLKKFEKSWMIGKFITGWKKSTKLQKGLTFVKITFAVAISTALFVLSGGGLIIALLVASLSIGLLGYYIAKDVINIAKEKLTSELSKACKGVIKFECKGIKDASKGITETAEKIRNGLNNCKNDLSEQVTNIVNLKSQIKELKEAIEKEKQDKKNKINEYEKQKEEIAKITNNLASTISSSLKNFAQVEKTAKNNLSYVEEAQKDIAVIEKTCDEITTDSQEIKKLSDGITNKIEKFNKTTVDKLTKFVDTKDDGTVFEKSKLSRRLSKEETTKNNTEKLSKKIDDLEDEIFPQKLDKLYSKAGFFAKESEGSNETIKNLINKISKSNVDPTKFAKLLTEIINDQNKMNKVIMESSTKISNLAKKIEDEHAQKVKDFCTKIASTLATFKTNEETLLDMQKTHKKELISNLKKIFGENLLKQEDTKKLEDLKEKFKNGKSFNKVFNFIFSEKESENQDFSEDEILIIKDIINDKELVRIKPEEVAKITDTLDIIGNIETTIKSISDINNKCTGNISKIKDKDIKDIEDEANKINESIKNLQSFSKKLNVEIINKSAHIATASAGAIIGGVVVGTIGTTVGLPVTLAAGGAVLLGTALYKVIEHYKSNKN